MVRVGIAGNRTRRNALPRAVGGLRVRLILSYSLVTLTVLATIGIASAATQSSRGVIPVDQAGVSAVLTKDTASAESDLAAGTLEPDAIRLGVAVPLMTDLARNTRGHPLAVAVFDARGRLITDDGCTSQQYAQANSAACAAVARAAVSSLLADPAARRAIRDVALGQTNGRSVTGSAARRGFIAAPLGAAGQQPAGVLAVVFNEAVPPQTDQPFLGGFFSLLWADRPQGWLPILLLTMFTGTGAGLLLSHRLVRRLRAMASTVRVWSHGDLHPTADAGGTDELGRLGADLNHMAEQVRNLLEVRREVAMQQERNRVRRDLHDGVKQELFGISMQLATARESLRSGAGGIDRYLEEAQRLGLRAQRELTAIIEELRPPLLRHGDLRAALSVFTTEFQRQSHIHVLLQAPDQITVPEAYEVTLFRILQEALANVRRHSAATQVAIGLALADGELRLTVTDDGRGLPADLAASGGLGLATMRQRVEALGGRLALTAASPGTRVEVAMPAPPEEPD